MPRFVVHTDAIIEFLRFCRCKKCFDMSRLDWGHQRYRSGLKKCLKAQCRVFLCKLILELNSWDSVDAKNGMTSSDWTKDTRDNDWWPLDVHSFILKNRDKGVLLLVHFFYQKEYSLFPIFQDKGVLADFFFFKLALLLLQKWTKRSTPFGQKMDQKEYSFWSKRSTPFPSKFHRREYSFWSKRRSSAASLIWPFNYGLRTPKPRA